MPKAVNVFSKTFDYDLKTCEGGKVVLRRLSNGESLERRALTMSMYAHTGKSSDDRLNFELHTEQLQMYDFKNCIVDHNLEDEDGRQLDFRKREDVRKLDSIIAQEIEGFINEVNGRTPEELAKELAVGNPSSFKSGEPLTEVK